MIVLHNFLQDKFLAGAQRMDRSSQDRKERMGSCVCFGARDFHQFALAI
jgi:hypothetical protein